MHIQQTSKVWRSHRAKTCAGKVSFVYGSHVFLEKDATYLAHKTLHCQISSLDGDDQRIPGVVCFCRFLQFCISL